MKVVIPGFVIAEKADDWDAREQVVKGMCMRWSAYGNSEAGRMVVGRAQMSFDLPDDWNPVPQQIEQLQAKEAELTKQYLTHLNALREEMSNLKAITHEPPREVQPTGGVL